MPLDPAAKRFLDRLAAVNPPSALSLTVSERRSALEQLLKLGGSPQPLRSIEERSLPGPAGPLPIRIYTPEGAAAGPQPALVYFHGGGLVAGSLETHDGICRSLAQASRCRIIALDYRLAPEHPFPAAIADGCAAVAWLSHHARELGIDPERLGIGGDSAGATLATVVCQLTSARDVPLAAQLLICPITDLTAATESRREFAHGYLLDEAILQHDLEHYIGAHVDPADPRVSPLRAVSLAGLPSSSIHTAEFDPVRDEGRAYAERLREAGVPTRYRCHSGMMHLFYGLSAFIPYAASAFELIGADVRALLSADEPAVSEG